MRRLIRCHITGTKLQAAMLLLAGLSQTVYCQAQVRQNIVINNILQENRIRIEGFLGQNDAIIKGFVVANGTVLVHDTLITIKVFVLNRCETTHKCEIDVH